MPSVGAMAGTRTVGTRLVRSGSERRVATPIPCIAECQPGSEALLRSKSPQRAPTDARSAVENSVPHKTSATASLTSEASPRRHGGRRVIGGGRENKKDGHCSTEQRPV